MYNQAALATNQNKKHHLLFLIFKMTPTIVMANVAHLNSSEFAMSSMLISLHSILHV